MANTPQSPSPVLSAARPNRLKRLLADGQVGIGCLLSYNAPWLVEVLGMTGHDYITIDLEHEPFNPETAAALIRTADLVGMTSIVRMASSEAIFPYLSAGAQ